MPSRRVVPAVLAFMLIALAPAAAVAKADPSITSVNPSANGLDPGSGLCSFSTEVVISRPVKKGDVVTVFLHQDGATINSNFQTLKSGKKKATVPISTGALQAGSRYDFEATLENASGELSRLSVFGFVSDGACPAAGTPLGA